MSKTEQRCCALVGNGTRRGYSHRCTRAGHHEEDGRFYCKQHLPTEVERRYAERQAKWNKEWAEQQAAVKASIKLADFGRELRTATAEVANIAVKALHQEATYDDVMEAAAKLDRLRGAGE